MQYGSVLLMSLPTDAAGVPPHLDIRKYPNRRYYDSTHSRHLTLEEIRDLIRDGHDITVRDSKSGTDITAQVLTQIILELETPKLGTFPVPLLVRIIRVNDRWVRDFVETYFNQAFRAYLEYQQQFEERMRQMRGMAGNFPAFAPWTGMVFPSGAAPVPTPAAAPEPAAAPGGGRAPGRAEGGAEKGDAAGMRQVVEELRRQVASLQRQVGGRGAGRPGARSRGRRKA